MNPLKRIRFALWRWLVRDRHTGRAARLQRELDRARGELVLQLGRDRQQRAAIVRLEGELSFAVKQYHAQQGVRHGR